MSRLRARAQRLVEALNRPATLRFVALALAVVWFGTVILSLSDYRTFDVICNHDPGAVLRTDEVISQGWRPGADFFYYYGLLPLAISHVFFGVLGRSPISLLALMLVISGVSYVGFTRTIAAFHPTRLGALLIAIAAGHATYQLTPTHAMEAAVLVWAVALRIQGHSVGALALATVALFVKMSMASAVLVGLVGLIVLDALRTRRSRRLFALLAIPIVFGIGAGLCVAWLGAPALIGSLDARAGAAVYRAWNLGFLHEGRGFWHPAGHNLNWYLGSVAGPWCVGSIALVFLAVRGAYRLVRVAIQGGARDAALISEEARAIGGLGNVAFVVGFYGPALSVYNYAWLLLAGLGPTIGRARLAISKRGAGSLPGYASAFGWLSLGVVLLLSQTTALKRFAALVRDRRVVVGRVTMEQDQADELTATLALGHSVGGGGIAAVAQVANFGLVDPTIREGHYWMLVYGMPTTKALGETIRLAESSDAIFVTKHDYQALDRIPEFKLLLEKSERLHDGKRFLLLRPGPRPLR